MIDFIMDIFENTSGWMKWTGASFIVVLVALFFIATQPSGNEVVRLQSTVAEIRENATNAAIDAGVQASEESSNAIMSGFHESGVSMAQQVEDPVTQGTIVFGMDVAGFLFAAWVVLIIMGTILGALGFDVSWLKN